MQYIQQLIPLSLAIAVCAFIAKEVVEYVKKRKNDAKRRRAMNTILLALCQRNLWVLETISRNTELFEKKYEDKAVFKLEIKEHSNNSYDWHIVYDKYREGARIQPVQISQIEKLLLDAALIDVEFFNKIIDAHDAILVLDHLRYSLLEYTKSFTGVNETSLLWGFAGYVQVEAPKITKALEALAEACGGNFPLEKRVR